MKTSVFSIYIHNKISNLGKRDEVMMTGVRMKFGAEPGLRELLIASHPHPLLSIKRDDYWGVTPGGAGEHASRDIYWAPSSNLANLVIFGVFETKSTFCHINGHPKQ